MKSLVALLAGAGLLFTGVMYSVALRDPVVRRASIALPHWPSGAAAIRVALLTDIHVGGPDMPPSRLDRIVAKVNALKPDLVLIGGDFVSDKALSTRAFSGSEAIDPLKHLKAPLGVVAVYGNHDIWRGLGDIAPALKAGGVRVLINQAAEVGPLSLGGVSDAFTSSDDVPRTVWAMRKLPGAKVMLSHSPDVVPKLPDDVTLILAGHTHCGQIRIPVIGTVSSMSNTGDRYACGFTVDGKKRVITSAGLGTSIMPLRLGAVPDIWLMTLGPAR